jgi:hypothetical protein
VVETSDGQGFGQKNLECSLLLDLKYLRLGSSIGRASNPVWGWIL